MPPKDGIKRDILRDALDTCVGHSTVFQPNGGIASVPCPMSVLRDSEERMGSGYDALAGESHSDPAHIRCDPTAAPSLGNQGGSATPACRVNNKIARIRRHAYAPLDYLLGCLYHIARRDQTNLVKYRAKCYSGRPSHSRQSRPLLGVTFPARTGAPQRPIGACPHGRLRASDAPAEVASEGV